MYIYFKCNKQYKKVNFCIDIIYVGGMLLLLLGSVLKVKGILQLPTNEDFEMKMTFCSNCYKINFYQGL